MHSSTWSFCSTSSNLLLMSSMVVLNFWRNHLKSVLTPMSRLFSYFFIESFISNFLMECLTCSGFTIRNLYRIRSCLVTKRTTFLQNREGTRQQRFIIFQNFTTFYQKSHWRVVWLLRHHTSIGKTKNIRRSSLNKFEGIIYL